MEDLTLEDDVVICKIDDSAYHLRLKYGYDASQLVNEVSRPAAPIQADRNEYTSEKVKIVLPKEAIDVHGKVSYTSEVVSPSVFPQAVSGESVFTAAHVQYAASSGTFEDRSSLGTSNNQRETYASLVNEPMLPVSEISDSKGGDSNTNLLSSFTDDVKGTALTDDQAGEVAQDNVQCSDSLHHQVSPELPLLQHSTPVHPTTLMKSGMDLCESKTHQVCIMPLI